MNSRRPPRAFCYAHEKLSLGYLDEDFPISAGRTQVRFTPPDAEGRRLLTTTCEGCGMRFAPIGGQARCARCRASSP